MSEGEIDYIGADELVFNNDKINGIHAGGFSVNSIMMKAGMSPIMTMNNQLGGTSDKVSDLFNDLVVPNWALSYSNMHGAGKYKEVQHDDDSDNDISDDLHDKLLELVKENNTTKNKHKITKKNKKLKRKSTKKRR